VAKNRLAQLKADARAAGWLDQVRTPNDERALLAGHVFDIAAAERVCHFFRRFIRHGDTTIGVRSGDVFELLDWQKRDLIYPLYGWQRPDGTRRFRRCYASTAKKNGKSTLTGGLGLYHLVGDREPNAEVYIAAGDRKQAAIVYRQAAKMVRLSPALSDEIEPVDSAKRLVYAGGGDAFLESLSHEAHTKEGYNCSCLIFDELHAQPDSKLWDVLLYSGRARRQPLLIVITTAGSDLEGICYEQYRYAKAVHFGEIEDLTYLCCLHEAEDPTCALDDTAALAAANPSLGVSLTLDSLLEDARSAKVSSRAEAKYRRYSLNQWVNDVGGWLDLDKWDACAHLEEFNRMLGGILLGRECFGGLDLSSKIDLSCWMKVFPIEAEDLPIRFLLWPRFWIPQQRVDECAKKGDYRYASWVRSGLLQVTDGGVIDYGAIKAQIVADRAAYKIRTVAFDPWNAGDLTVQLAGEGIEAVEVPQNAKRLSEPAKYLEALMRDGRLLHGGNPVLRWMAQNVAVRIDVNDNILPQKPRKGGPERIDGIAAAVNAFSEIKRLLIEGDGGMTAGEFIDQFGGILELD